MSGEISSTYSIIFTLFWQSSLFITAGLITSYLLKRHPARAHQVLLLSMIAAVTVPFMSVAVKHYELGIFTAKPEPEPEPVVEYSPVPSFVSINTAILQAYNEISLINSEPAVVVEPENVELPWNMILLIGWIATSLILLSRLFVTFILGMRVVRKAQPFEYPKITESIKAAASKLGVRENLAVYSSKSATSPVIWCWERRPILLLPSDRKLLSNKIDWVGILCHELAHLKRRDHIAGLFSELIVGVFPWHPLLWLAKKRLISLSEHACDDWVIAANGCGINYAESLLDLVPVRQMAFVPAVVHSKNDLKGRVMRIIKETYGNPRLGVKWVVATILITTCIAFTVAFAQTRPARITETDSASQQDVSNEPNEPMVDFNLKDAGLDDIVENLMEWTGKSIIPASETSDVRITIYAPERMPQSEAIALIYDALFMKGFVTQETDNVIFIMPISDIHVETPIPILDVDDQLVLQPDKDIVVQKFFRLRNYSPSEMANILQPMLGDSGYVIVDDEAGSLSIIDTVKKLIGYERVIQQYDTEVISGIESQTFELKYRSVAEVVDNLRLVLSSTGVSITSNQDNRRRGGRSNASSTVNAATIEAGGSLLVLIAEPINNWIIAKASSEYMELIESWIARFDVPIEVTPIAGQRRFEIRNGEPTVAENDDIVVTKSFKLTNFSPSEMAELVEPMLSEEGFMTAEERTGTLLVKDRVVNLIEIENAIARFDVPKASLTEVRTFVIENTDVTELAQLIELILKDQQLTLIPVPERKWIIARADEETMKFIEELLENLDTEEVHQLIDVDEVRPRIYTLKYLDSVQTATLLNNIFSGGSGENTNTNISVEVAEVPGTQKIVVMSRAQQAYEIVEAILEQLDTEEATNTSTQQDVSNEPDEPMVSINLNDVDLDNIIETLMEWTGKSIIPASEVMDISITIYAPERMPKSKALDLIYEALFMNGFSTRVTEDIIYIEPVEEVVQQDDYIVDEGTNIIAPDSSLPGRMENVFVIAGDFDLDGDGDIDDDAKGKITNLIQKWGGVVKEPEQLDNTDSITIGIDTDFVILGERPIIDTAPTEDDLERDPEAMRKYNDARERNAIYRQIMDQAQSLWIPIFTYEKFLYFIGYNSQASQPGAFD